ncbi:ABC transporter substrate-binding protein [Catenulispora pinisilvae]|uniref:ABC transporter substrate-binding protein n=1 Tax=Catenulispora pinisilvae TaxID=2705253 RepID=UPI001890CC1B|nr:ABC transporter substrate-binding protein [Catenulispora pinisilvae]
MTSARSPRSRNRHNRRHHRIATATTAIAIAALSLSLGACGARLSADQKAAAIAYGQGANGNGSQSADGSQSSGNGTGGTTGGTGSTGTTGGGSGGTTGGAVGGTSGGAVGGTSTGGTTGGKGSGGTTGGKGSGGTTGGKTSGGGTSGGGTSGGGTGGGSGGGSGAPGADNCVGTATGSTATGVTANSISLGNASDLSGPIGGLFSSAPQAVQAYAAYFNATHPNGICGRKLTVHSYDSQTSDAGDNQQTLTACQSDFALVGSVSAFDSGGAASDAQCGIPDLQAVSTTRARQTCAVCFGTDSQQLPLVPQVQPDFWNKQFPGAGAKAAFLYVDTGTTAQQAKSWEQAYAKDGFNWLLDQPIGVSESNYTPYVVKMQQAGVQYVQFLGAYQEAATLAQAMQQQGFTPKVFVLDPTGYDPNFVQQAGSAANNAFVFSNAAMFEEAGSNPELQLYTKWLHQVAPGATPTYFGMFAWSSAELFTRLANQIGPNLTRPAMVQALSKVHNYTGNGLFAPQDVGGKTTSPCALFMQYTGSGWKRVSPGSGWTCGNLINSGVS